MKVFFTLFGCLLLIFSLSAQQEDVRLPGVVVEQNSGFYNNGKVKYLSNTHLKAVGASQFSDAHGKFTLVFANRPFGNVVRVFASKSGYELVNDEELKKAAVLGRTLPLKVVMCEEGQLYENQVAYYKIVEDATKTTYEQRLAVLGNEGRERELLMAEMQIEFNQQIKMVNQAKVLLLKQLHAAQERARDLADKFVTINLDDQSATYQRAFRAFLDKDIDRALMILDSVDLKQRLEVNSTEKVKEEQLIDTLQASVIKREKQIEQDINQCIFKARLHILKYEFNEAEALFELALKYKPKDEALMFNFAYFLQKQNRFTKAQIYYESVLKQYQTLAEKNPDVYLPYVAGTFNNLGLLLDDTGDMTGAEAHYKQALSIWRTLAKQNPDAYLSDLVMELNNLGGLFIKMKNIVEGKACLEEALNIYQISEEQNSKVDLFDVAMTFNNSGLLLNEINDITEAKVHYEQALSIYRILVEQNLDMYLSNMATILNNLGNLLVRTEDISGAKTLFEEALEISKTLAKRNSDAYLSDVAMTLYNLGQLMRKNDDTLEAKAYLEKTLKICRALAEQNPNVYLSRVAMVLNTLGIILKDNNEITVAKARFEEALSIRRTLAGKNPQAYNLDACTTAINLGLFYEQLLKETGDTDLKTEGVSLMKDVQNRLSVYSAEHPTVTQYMTLADRLTEFFATYGE